MYEYLWFSILGAFFWSKVEIWPFFELFKHQPHKWLNTLKKFVSNGRRIFWVCLTILLGWRLKD